MEPAPSTHSAAFAEELDVEERSTWSFLKELRQHQWAEQPLQAIFDKVERAKQEWEATVDALPELICLVDDEGRVLRANQTVEAWGLSQVVAVKGRDVHALIHPACTNLFCYLRRFLRQAIEKTDNEQPRELTAHDSILQRHLTIQVQPMPAHKPLASHTSVVVIHDVSERKRAEDALHKHTERLKALNEIGEAILAACSPDAIAQAALGRLRQLVPYRQARVTLWKTESDQCLVLAAISNGEAHLMPGKLIPKDAFRGSEERWLDRYVVAEDLPSLPNLSPVERELLSEGVRSYISVPLLVDRHYIGSLNLGFERPGAPEREHVDMAYQVADLLAIAIRQAQLHEELNQANGELQAALQAKEQMSQNVSHDMRSPLTVIDGYLELLANTDLGPLTAGQEQAVQIMRRQVEHLLHMVTQLLTLQTIDDKTLQTEPVELCAWLRQVVLPWEVRTAQAGIHLQLEVPCAAVQVRADIQLLAHVVDNLLDNAIKFSPSGGLVRVRAQLVDTQQAVIAVSDEGVGIAPDKLTQVFERFYQVEGGDTHRCKGLGIGLALCQAIVQAHGGRIWAESQGEGKGSTFTIALRLNDNANI